ncbi:MAG: battenin family protein [archaeon]|nr:battenin family protein [archaeon]
MSEVKDENENLNPKEEGESKEESKDETQKDGFENVPKIVKYQLFGLFFFMGIINHLGNILVLTGGRILAYNLKLERVLTLYTSSSSIFAVCTRMINSRLFIKVSYQKRMICVCFLMIFGYVSMFAVFCLFEGPLEKHNVICFILTFIPSFCLGSCYALGEGAIMAYLRNYPPTLIAGFSSGTGLSGLFSASLNFLSQLVSVPYKYFYIVLAPLGPIYLGLFFWSYQLYLRYFHVEENLDSLEKDKEEEKQTAPLVADKEKEETAGEPRDSDTSELPVDKDADLSNIPTNTMEDMNKKNKELSCYNFMRVMQMAGRVIINMGLIYLIQFFCQNALFVRDALMVDIPFLPDGCKEGNHDQFRKGRFEFVNLFFQFGMFTSKTLIKLVRHIQPIEVYTIAVAVITVFAAVQYVWVFAPWWAYPISMFILGFFGGG